MKIYFVDSFTDMPFKGNPAAVVLQDKVISDKLMQSIAQEIGFSETAFLLQEKADKYHLRWFSPTIEVGLCGHATLASAKVFFTYLNRETDSVTFTTKYGKLQCSQEDNNIKMNFPRDISDRLEIHKSIKDYFAFPLKETILFSRLNCYLTVFVADSVLLSDLDIDITQISKISGVVPKIRGLIISNQNNGVVKMRFFDPWEGIPEDPVTGSAALVVSEYWFELLNCDYLAIEQLSSRGGKMFVKKNEKSLSIIGASTILLEGNLMVGKYGK